MSATVLVVDDDLIVQDSVKCLLDTDGYEVTTAATGEEALSRLARQGFDVVVSDIKMPGLTGLDVLERSRMLNPRPGVVLMTGYATLDTAIEALRRGASDYLLKPFEVDDLRLGVQRALHHREPVEAARPPGSGGAAPGARPVGAAGVRGTARRPPEVRAAVPARGAGRGPRRQARGRPDPPDQPGVPLPQARQPPLLTPRPGGFCGLIRSRERFRRLA
jgi:CheY-like chemotaxis protein